MSCKGLLVCFLCLILSSNVLMAQYDEVRSGIYKWEDLNVRKGDMREGRRLLEGSEFYFEYLEVHATTQEPGAKPAAPHTQQNLEEIIFVKEGTMKMTMNGESKILGAGSLVLIPPLVEQSLENVGNDNLTYFVFMFRSKKPMDITRGIQNGHYQFLNFTDLQGTKQDSRIQYLPDRPTAMCESLNVHSVKLLQKGSVEVPHNVGKSQAILVLEGEIEVSADGKKTAGKEKDFYLVKAGQSYGISNAGDAPCRYLVVGWK